LARVLRAEVGQEFDVATPDQVRRGVITAISPERVEFALGKPPDCGLKVESRALPTVTLVLAIFKFDRMEWAMEKCTEIGVARIIPVAARRSDAHLVAAAAKRHERWQRIVRHAAEQSRRVAPPELVAPVKLTDLAAEDRLPRPSSRIVFAESEQDARLADVLPPRSDEIALAVGPEGGWADTELEWFRGAGWTAASLGPTILRAETAAIVATALAFDVVRRQHGSRVCPLV
jgi:16S rRNA (uracil1498-N3)-methyltransferase